MARVLLCPQETTTVGAKLCQNTNLEPPLPQHNFVYGVSQFNSKKTGFEPATYQFSGVSANRKTHHSAMGYLVLSLQSGKAAAVLVTCKHRDR